MRRLFVLLAVAGAALAQPAPQVLKDVPLSLIHI
jgi:hypothetical protein